MIDAAVMAYGLALPLVTLWAMLMGIKSQRYGLARCSAAVLAHYAAIQLWWAYGMGDGYQGQPFLFMALSLFAMLMLVARKPADKPHAILGGALLFGMLTSLLYGVTTLWTGYSPRADWNYWFSLFCMGWAVLVILLGWTHEQVVSRVVGAGIRAATRLFLAPHHGGLAR